MSFIFSTHVLTKCLGCCRRDFEFRSLYCGKASVTRWLGLRKSTNKIESAENKKLKIRTSPLLNALKKTILTGLFNRIRHCALLRTVWVECPSRSNIVLGKVSALCFLNNDISTVIIFQNEIQYCCRRTFFETKWTRCSKILFFPNYPISIVLA